MTECCGGACETPRAPASIERHRRVWLVAASGVLLGGGILLSWLAMPRLGLAGFVLSILLSAPEPFRRAVAAARRRSLDINVLMMLAVLGAGILGEWTEAAAVVWLFGVAQWLESFSLARARHAIARLITLVPGEALVRRDGVEALRAVDEIVPGDVVIVRPGDRLPVDGRVAAGESALDQSPVTGESRPVEVGPGAEVYAGSVNGSAALELEATRPASDSTIARIVRLVEQAERRRAPVQSFVDRFARRYTPAVVALAVLLAVVPPLVTAGTVGWSEAFSTWGYRALALLVVACPCALVISTPVSIVSALTVAARHGVLVKGGVHLERLAAVRAVAFDKTGTLTDGQVSVRHVSPVAGASAHGLLSVAASLESRSEHPIGRAIVAHARDAGLHVAPGDAFRALPGFGAEATVAAAPGVVGSHRLFEQRQLCTPALHAEVEAVESAGWLPILVGHGGAAVGVLGVADAVRRQGQDVVDQLRAGGIVRVVLLTGDSTANARAIGADLALDDVHAALLPADKVERIARLREEYGPVAMVGDGINDAPALAAADVGIAMGGGGGADVALETADVALVTDDLSRIPWVLRLGRATLSNIHLNIGLALGLKLAFVGLAATGLATLWMAVLADTGTSLLVTANSLRLLRVR